MNASIDIDLLAHLGDFKNVDLLQRGKYCIQVGLYYGDQKIKIIPVGIFSAPSSTNSFVGDQRISDADNMNCCEVDEYDHVFRSRQLNVRYKGERHELNEGVNWRLTLTNVDVRNAVKNKSVIRCKQLLYIEFSLLFINLTEDISEEKDKNGWKIVANQTLCLQQIGSDLHHYFPVTFDGTYNAQLDCMVFGMITGISYAYLNPAVTSLCPRKISTTQQANSLSIQDPSTFAVAAVSQDDTRSPESTPRLSQSDASPGSRTIKRQGSGTPDLLTPSSEYLQNTISRITTTIENTSQQVNSKFQSFRSFLSNSTKQQSHHSPPPRPTSSSSSSSSSQSARTSTGRTLFSPPTRHNHARSSTDSHQEPNSSQRQKNNAANKHNNIAASSIDVTRTDSIGGGDTAPPIFEDDRLSITNISRTDAMTLLECYFIPIITNDQQVITSCQFVLAIYEEWKAESESILAESTAGLNSPKLHQKKTTTLLPSFPAFQDHSNSHSHTKSFPSTSSEREREAFVVQLLQPSMIQQRPTDLIEQMLQKAQSQMTSEEDADGLLLQTLFPLLQAQMIYQNKQLSLKWSLLLNTLKMMMSRVKERLMSLYRIEMEIFWKQQQMIHTRSIEGSHKMSSNKDQEILDMLLEHIVYERNQDQPQMKANPSIHSSTSSSSSIVTVSAALSSVSSSTSSLRSDVHTESSSIISSMIAPVMDMIHFYARGMTIFDKNVHMYPTRLPYVFVEKYISEDSDSAKHKKEVYLQPKSYDGTHVIVLQHGFLGSSYDMKLLSQSLSLLCPEETTIIYSAQDNEHSSQETIASMGKKFTKEVLEFLKERCPSLLEEGLSPKYCRISFIGHSLGGLIIRASLNEPEMKPLLLKLHVFITLASPHLGNLFSESQLVSTGMWALSKFKNCVCLNELNLEDHSVPTESYLYQLAHHSKLSYFHRVIFVSSPKDQYVPFYSARIQTTSRIEQDTNHPRNLMVTEMAEALLASLDAKQLIRMTVVNNVEDASVLDMNAAIGRTAHISYLENPIVAYQMMQTSLPYLLGEE